jgi:hypothetical protein
MGKYQPKSGRFFVHNILTIGHPTPKVLLDWQWFRKLSADMVEEYGPTA